MDLSFPSEQGTGACFTVRSANTPFYAPSHITSVSNRLSFQEKRLSNEEVRDSVKKVTHSATNDTNKEEHTLLGNQGTTESHSGVRGQSETKEDLPDRFTKLYQNGTAVFDSENPAFERPDRRERKKDSTHSRSLSLDRRAGWRGSDSSTRADMSTLSAKGENTARELAIGQAGAENVRRAIKGYSFPSRMRSQSEHSSGIETSLGPKVQSITERIEKLYGSVGYDKAEEQSKIRGFPVTTTNLAQQKSYKWAEAGSFPRRLSSVEGTGLGTVKTFPWTPQKDKCSLVSAGGYKRFSGGQWQEQTQGRYSEEGGGSWMMRSGTGSLDRARSRNTVAAQIRSAWAATEITPEPASRGCLKEEPSSLKDLFDLRERNASGSKEQGRTNHREEISKRAEYGAKERDESNSSNTEDVFESSSIKVTERNMSSKTLSPPSSASVRNKINQFEALSQRAQGSVPRRAFSVPAVSTTRALGGLRDKWEGTKEGKDPPEKKYDEAGANVWTERALSVDESGLRSRREEKHTGLSCTDNLGGDFGKFFQLKTSLQLPVSTGTKRCCDSLYGGETDSSGVSNPGEANKAGVTRNAPALLKPAPSQVASPASDDDKTPTNTTSSSPCLSPTAPDNTTPEAKTDDRASGKTPDADSPRVPRPLATSSHSSLPGLMSADVNKLFPKGKKTFRDLDAWVAGLNSDNSAWDEDDDDYEDDDDDESTQKDEDSNYDSDSGESSVTITSNMSQSDRRSFCVSLSDLCNFAGIDDDSENESDEWQCSDRRSVSLSSDVSALSCVSVMPSEELDRLLEDVRSLGDNTLQDYNDVQVVVLHKEMGVGLGFSLAGGMDQDKPVTVHKVFHSGVAAQEGSIREGDHILSINGTALCDCGHWEALRVLRKAKSREMAVVVLRRGDLSGSCKRSVQGTTQGAALTRSTETGHRVCVCLEKNSRDLGFTLEGGVGSSSGDRPLIVQKIFQGGPVDKVCPGDEVLDIEGFSTVGMSRLEAWTLIRKLAPGPVNVVLRRPLKHLEA